MQNEFDVADDQTIHTDIIQVKAWEIQCTAVTQQLWDINAQLDVLRVVYVRPVVYPIAVGSSKENPTKGLVIRHVKWWLPWLLCKSVRPFR